MSGPAKPFGVPATVIPPAPFGPGGLVLGRRPGERLFLDVPTPAGPLRAAVEVVRVCRNGTVRLRVVAPGIPVWREEVAPGLPSGEAGTEPDGPPRAA